MILEKSVIYFFDTSRTKIGKSCLSKNLDEIVNSWEFPWMSCNQNDFELQAIFAGNEGSL